MSPGDGGYLVRRLTAPATDPAVALKRLRDALALENNRAGRTIDALDALTHLVAELEILCIREVRAARKAGALEERTRCVGIAKRLASPSTCGGCGALIADIEAGE